MTKNKQFHVVIVAAGHGDRFGGDVPKQYKLLNGKPVLRHSIEKFMENPGLKSLHVVINPMHQGFYEKAVEGLDLPASIHGGSKRKTSVYSALKRISYVLDDEILLVHDAARPFVTAIDALLEAMNGHDAATIAIPVSDTLRRGDEIVDREGLWTVQTPQAFRFGILKKAHETIKGSFTDDTGLVSAMGVPVKMVMGSRSNLKITVPEDFTIAEKLAAGGDIRTGMGFDVHAFSKEKGRKLILCGVELDHPFGLEGHSDADAALHALTDAILGAIGKGDIGQHFPPSNPKFKNMDSRVFLEEACRMVNGTVLNADITIICENPKIGPYRAKMQAKVAEILGIDVDRVNVKATTTEGLGFTGRGEGIAAQAIATVRLA
jgi:2-C-methyl-D-erythritol 4-phosphate cytidylyltransferase / 2-C-methyl-D-erythritol 2,4-cyclodiphosphate synthase